MKNELKLLVIELKNENRERTEYLNMNNVSDYSRTAATHTYNNTLKIIKKLENIINKY